MAEKNKPTKKAEVKKTVEPTKEKIESKPLPVDKEKTRQIEQGLESKVLDKPAGDAPTKSENKKEEPKAEAKPAKKKEEKPIVKKEEAVANGAALPISKKHSVYICSFIKNKSIDKAIADLESVQKVKKAVPYKGETSHRKGMGPGRYPVKASGYFINLLKSLKGNVIVNGMDLDKSRIVIASASWASRPLRSGGRSAKRTNIILKAKEFHSPKGVDEASERSSLGKARGRSSKREVKSSQETKK